MLMKRKHNKLAKAVSLALAYGTLCTTAMTANVYAAEADDEEDERQTITITGSRIKSPNLLSASPLQILEASDIDASGIANIQELLLDNPTFGSPALSRTNSNFLTSGGGAATVDLRDLGSARTLVLVNGRRMVAGRPGTSAVDMNTIPAQFIERVEILTGGASSVYGSDAVAGVVNLVLKDEMEGFEFDAQYGESKEGDDTETQVSLTAGMDSANGKGNIMFHLGYTNQGPVFSRDRDISAVDQLSEIFFTGEDADVFNTVQPFFSSFPPQGRFDVDAGRYTFDQNNNLQLGFSANGDGTIGPDGFNRSAHRTIAVPTERYLFASKGNYELSDSHSVFFEGTYAASQTKTQLEPFPFSSTNIYSDGVVPLEFDVNGTILRNPFVPDDIYNGAVDVTGDGLRDLEFFAKRLIDVANRGNIADRDNFRFATGFEGEIFDGDWFYDVFYSYGQTKEAQISSGQVNVQNFRYALEAVTDTLDLDGDGITNEAVCVDATARSFGCVPVNIYGFNSITPAMSAYIHAPGMLQTFVSQEIIGGNLSGELFELPAGPFGIATGFEYREEFSRSEFDALQQQGLNAGNAIPSTKGEFDVTEFYLEMNAPIMEGLNLKAAVRSSDYSTVGSTESWNIGFDYAITDWVRLRAIQAQSTRAPNINELFSPPSQTFPSGLIDPCLGVTASSSGAGDAACRTDPGVAANIAANGTFTLNQADTQGITGFTAGNPNVTEEVGESTTIGIVITPDDIEVLEDFSFTIDYFDIQIEDAIVATPRQFILDQCYGGDTTFCNFITRRPTDAGTNSAGSIQFLNSGVSNSGGVGTEGIDLTVNYTKEMGPGKFRARLAYTNLMESYTVPLPGADQDPLAGEIDTPEHKANLNLGYRWDDFNITLGATYLSSVAVDDQFGLGPGAPTIDATVYVDTQVSYQLNENFEIYGGVDNLLDEAPPLIPSGIPGNNTGLETSGSSYDAIGQRWYMGVRAKF